MNKTDVRRYPKRSVGKIWWRRLHLAVRVVEPGSSIRESIDFLLTNVLGSWSTQALAVWHAGSNGAYSLMHQVGLGEIVLPEGVTDWASANREVIVAGEPLVWTVPTSEQLDLLHIAAPSAVPGVSYLVLHVVMPAAQIESQADLRGFLLLLAELLHNAVRNSELNENCNVKSAASDSMLTGRQLSILELLQTDMTYRDIASELGYSESTIKAEALRIYEKLNVSDRKSAVSVAQSDQRFEQVLHNDRRS